METAGRLPRTAASLGLPWRAAVASAVCMLAGCPDDAQKHPDPGKPNPIASTPPAPLASGAELIAPAPGSAGATKGTARVGIPADSAGRLILTARDAGAPPPEPLRQDQSMPRDRLAARDGVGVGLDARWIWSALPKPPGVQEVDSDAIGAAATKVSPTMEIELVAVGRMRLSFLGVSFPLPARAELRARADRYGHVLVWPNGKTYRVLAPGALRSVLAERRADVTPLVPGKRRKLPRGSYMGLATERDEIVTPTGKLVIEQADVALAGRGGPLLCRALAELDTVQPSTPVCAKRGRVPLKAKYRWATGGEIEFEVTALARRQDIPIGLLYTPPAGALFKPAELPPEASGVFLTRNDLAGFRTSETKPEQPPGVEAPGEGLYAVNETDALQYLLLDGVPVAWVRPHQKQYVIGPKAGRYTVAWRDFLTTESTPPREVQLPARLVVGGDADGGK